MVLVSGRMWPGTFKCSFCDSQFPLSTALLTVSTVHMKLLTVNIFKDESCNLKMT